MGIFLVKGISQKTGCKFATRGDQGLYDQTLMEPTKMVLRNNETVFNDHSNVVVVSDYVLRAWVLGTF